MTETELFEAIHKIQDELRDEMVSCKLFCQAET